MIKFPEKKRYRLLRPWLNAKFGGNTWKVGLDAGLSCPHVVDKIGCVFCDPPSFTPAARNSERNIRNQVAMGIEGVQRAHPMADRFIAYFQSGTNTFGSFKYLKEIFSQSLEDPRIVGLSIGTRPDSISLKTLEMIREVAGEKKVIIEYGLQSIHEASSTWMRREHTLECFEKAVLKTVPFGFDVITHVMIGFPGERQKEVIETAKYCASLPLSGIKIHNLHVTINTPLAEWYFSGQFEIISQEEYIAQVCDMLEYLPEEMVIHRLSSSSPRPYLIAPEWCRSVPLLMNEIDKELERRNTWQSRLCENNKNKTEGMTIKC